MRVLRQQLAHMCERVQAAISALSSAVGSQDAVALQSALHEAERRGAAGRAEYAAASRALDALRAVRT